MNQSNHISVCVCTFKRPEMLGRLLFELQKQETRGLFDYSVVIVDNDKCESAREVAATWAGKANISIKYFVEPEQNIALARNKAVANAGGGFIAFIDDDEFPVKDWLLNLYKALTRFNANGVLGPVLAHFEEEPPEWAIKSAFFERPRHSTGHILDWTETRTGNVLLKRNVFKENEKWFDEAFGSGGEDRDFFWRQIREGKHFLWCNEAHVYETVPPSRWSARVICRRALLRGKMATLAPGLWPISFLKSLTAILIYTCFIPFSIFRSRDVFIQNLMKNCWHIGKVFGFIGIDLVKDKYVNG